ncbi:hypothetical protein ACHAW5_006056 [Stephanodiscus triporus]|uniref:MI domain-containing protein n=1 Tax=Stephanodiscus triporus TaxID=2934178 RepID=A0ABD3QAZ6_9STRA
MPAHKKAPKELAKQLHADAKEFVPSSATAAAWKPNNEAPKSAVAAASSESSMSGKTPLVKNGASSDKSASAKLASADVVKYGAKAPPAKNGVNSGKTAAAKPSAVESLKQAPQAPPAKTGENSDKPPVSVHSAAEAAKQAPKTPTPSAWGSKPSEAIKMAGPIRPQQKPEVQKQHQNHAPSEATKKAGPNKPQHKPEVQQRQQQPNAGRGGRDGGRDKATKKAGPNKPQHKPEVQQRQQQPNAGRGGRDGGRDSGRQASDRSDKKHEQGGGVAPPGNSWARAAAKGGGKKDAEGQRGRQSKPRGGTASSGEHGGDENNPPASSWARAAAKPGAGRGKEEDDHRGRQSQSGGGVISGGEQGGDENNPNWSRAKAVPLDLLRPGEGKSDAEKAVKRIDVDGLLEMRLKYVSPPSSWEGDDATKPPAACLWDSPSRISDIEEASTAPRIGGDVSLREKSKRGGGQGGKSNPNDTAPPLEECKPLDVNDETRWKAKVMDGGKEAQAEEADGKDEILRKAMLILNKLSMTKFDKLSDEFISCGIGRDIECLTGAVGLIVNYAQEQQHFSSMYARLCLKLANTPMEGIDDGAKKGKKFKKILLERCQTEFETDTSTKIKEATRGMTDTEEIEYHSNLIKKHYLGHMRFIGELYKGELISIKIMIRCLPALLKGENEESSDDIDEEKIACFTKLMTVIGSSLELQSEAMKVDGKADVADSLADCWKTVEIMARENKKDGPTVSNRIKFMLQDLLEMKENGWVTRRKEETAKTLSQIHKEVANEERAAARRIPSSGSIRGVSKGSMRRGASSGDVRVIDKTQDKPQVDEDGFVSVAAFKGRSVSMTALQRSQSEGFQKYTTRGSTVLSTPEGHASQGKFSVLNTSDSRRKSKNESSDKAEVIKPEITYPSVNVCGTKAKLILKEYLAGGDTDDAVLSIHELVGAGSEGSFERGTEVVKSAVLSVLEMRQEDVDKFLVVFLRCAKEEKIEREAFVSGLNDPLEYLSDVAIDAPLAIPHLASIVAELVKADVVPFDFLLNSPDYFRTDQNAANFGAKIMKKIGGEAFLSDDYTVVIEKLMTDDDRRKYSSAIDLIAEA